MVAFTNPGGTGPGANVPAGFYTGLATGISEGGEDTGSLQSSIPFQTGAQGGISASQVAGENANIAMNNAAAVQDGFQPYSAYGGGAPITQNNFGPAPVFASPAPGPVAASPGAAAAQPTSTAIKGPAITIPSQDGPVQAHYGQAQAPSWAFGGGGGVSAPTSAAYGGAGIPNSTGPEYAPTSNASKVTWINQLIAAFTGRPTQ